MEWIDTKRHMLNLPSMGHMKNDYRRSCRSGVRYLTCAPSRYRIQLLDVLLIAFPLARIPQPENVPGRHLKLRF